MIAVIQRVTRASVTVDGSVTANIGAGLLVLVGVDPSDGSADASTLASKLVGLRVFADAQGLMNHSVLDIGGEVLVVSQFTLMGDVRKGRRPSFIAAGAPGMAAPLVEEVALAIEAQGVRVGRGIFGAHMVIDLVNEGPVTLIVRTEAGRLV